MATQRILPWPSLPRAIVARFLSAHSALGLALSALLYIVCISGTMIVFHEETTRWEQPQIIEATEIDPDRLQAGMEAFRAEHEGPFDQLRAVVPTQTMPRTMVGSSDTYHFVNSDGALGPEIDHGFAEFLVDLHYYLHLPSVLGLTIVGLLGAMMLGLILSGFLSHPKIFKDAFRMRRDRSAQLAETDLHNRFSVWSAPFSITSALTGSILGLASILAFALAVFAYEGDTTKVFPPIFGDATPAGVEAAEPLDITSAVSGFLATEPDYRPWLIHLNHAGQVGQNIEILAQNPDRLALYEQFSVSQDGVVSEPLGLTEGLAGQQIAASLYTLHFGSWGGLTVKLIYLAGGVMLSLVVVTGVEIWLLKRRQKGRPAPLLERMWTSVVWGVPALIALIMCLSVYQIVSDHVLPPVFWLGLMAVVIASCFAADRSRLGRGLRFVTGFLVASSLTGHYLEWHGQFQGDAAWGVQTVLAVIAIMMMAQPTLSALRSEAAIKHVAKT